MKMTLYRPWVTQVKAFNMPPNGVKVVMETMQVLRSAGTEVFSKTTPSVWLY